MSDVEMNAVDTMEEDFSDFTFEEEEPVDEPLDDENLEEDDELDPNDDDQPTDEEDEPDFSDDDKAFLDRFEITYNGEQIKYESKDDLIRDAQKGRNYDRILEQRNGYRDNPAYKYIDDYMKQSGYKDPAKFVRDIRINTKAEELVAKGMKAEDARAEAEQFVSNMPMVDARGQEIGSFLEWQSSKVSDGIFPEAIDEHNIPQEVLDAYERGESLKEAYTDYMLKDIRTKTEQSTLKKVADNKKKSAGPIEKGVKSDNKSMTPEQITKKLSSMGRKAQEKWIDANFDMIEKSGYFG